MATTVLRGDHHRFAADCDSGSEDAIRNGIRRSLSPYGREHETPTFGAQRITELYVLGSESACVACDNHHTDFAPVLFDIDVLDRTAGTQDRLKRGPCADSIAPASPYCLGQCRALDVHDEGSSHLLPFSLDAREGPCREELDAPPVSA